MRLLMCLAICDIYLLQEMIDKSVLIEHVRLLFAFILNFTFFVILCYCQFIVPHAFRGRYLILHYEL